MASVKRKLEDLSVDEFMSGGFDSDESLSSEPQLAQEVTKKKKKKTKKKDKVQNEPLPEAKKSAKIKPKGNKSPEKAVKKSKSKEAKQSLAEKLKEKDPEFYEFLKDEDEELLEFDGDVDDDDDDVALDDIDNDSEGEDDGKELEKELLAQSSGESSDEDAEAGGKFHKPPSKLEVASDDSEYESEDESEDDEEKKVKGEEKRSQAKGDKHIKVTLSMVKKWSNTIQTNPTNAVVHEAIIAFKAAVRKAKETDREILKYKVVGGTVFNAVVRLCLTEIVPAVQKLLNIPSLTKLKKPIPGKDPMDCMNQFQTSW